MSESVEIFPFTLDASRDERVKDFRPVIIPVEENDPKADPAPVPTVEQSSATVPAGSLPQSTSESDSTSGQPSSPSQPEILTTEVETPIPTPPVPTEVPVTTVELPQVPMPPVTSLPLPTPPLPAPPAADTTDPGQLPF